MAQRLDYSTLLADLMKGLHTTYAAVGKASLPRVLIDLAYLRTSQINGCAYCIDLHTRDLLKQGVPLEKLVLVCAWEEAGEVFDERERAALAWAETVTRVSEDHVPQSAFDAARAIFSEQELAELTLAISVMNTYNRLAIAFRKPPQATVTALHNRQNRS